MIITRTPFRISFIGGVTDFRDFYSRTPGAVVSSTINKYMYIMVKIPFDDLIHVRYGKDEIVKTVDEVQHPIVREALKLLGIERKIEIVSMADIPARMGLGSSSSFTVGLLKALHAYKRCSRFGVGAEQIAQEACKIEIDIMGKPIGKQDQYIAAYGGLRYFQFNPDETVETKPIDCDLHELSKHLILFCLGNGRDDDSILSRQKANIEQNFENLVRLRNLAQGASNIPDSLGDFLSYGWVIKRQLAEGVTNPEIDRYYQAAMTAGANGAKVLGAGGSGFLLVHSPFHCIWEVKQKVGLPVVDFDLEPNGSEVVYAD